MSVINTNITSMIGQSNLSKSQNALTTAMERLSSGMRINSAKDDAAGQAVANRMTSQIKGLAQAQRNANDGISIAQTAEGGLNQINDNLQRVRELTVQAQNGTNSASDIDSIQQEVNQRLEEIDRIASQTDFNGSKILDTAGGAKNISVQVGAKDDQQITITVDANTSWNKYDSAAGITLAQVGGENRQVTADGFDVLAKSADTVVNAEDVSFAAVIASPTGAALTAAEIREYTDASGKTAYALRTTAGDEAAFAVHFDENGVASLGAELSGANKVLANTTANAALTNASNVTAPGKSTAISTLDDALKAVDTQRSKLGAIQNRFESAITNLQTNETNLTSARSRIEDADYAVEVANMTRAQILQQAGTSVLAQANQVPQGVLSLLR